MWTAAAGQSDLRRELTAVEQQLFAHREDADTIAGLRRRVVEVEDQERRLSMNSAELGVLKGDNARLIALLKSTREYADFEVFCRDSNGISYVPQCR